MISAKAHIFRGLPWVALSVVVSAYIGNLMDAHENERLTKFRDKSALFGRELKPGEQPSWP